jgi:hypothetical protein
VIIILVKTLSTGLMSVQTVAEAATPSSPPAEQLQQKPNIFSSGFCTLSFQQQNSQILKLSTT